MPLVVQQAFLKKTNIIYQMELEIKVYLKHQRQVILLLRNTKYT